MRILAAALAVAAGPALGDAPSLSLPVDCVLGETCFLQQTVDADPGPGASDHLCGHLTYDGHEGSDFRAAPGVAVPVVAVADGRVLRVRDGEPDRRFAEPLAVADGRGCGNGVVIAHAGGLETQVCHLARGSVRVAPGDAVARGDVLGTVGASGIADFPHVELVVRRDGAVVDPFTGLAPGAGCGRLDAPLWDDAAAEALAAVERAQILAVGFHDGPLTIAQIEDGETAAPSGGRMEAGRGALVAYGLAMAVKAGDVHRIVLTGPGFAMDERVAMERNRAQEMRFAGRRLADGLAPGTYRARVEILRGGRVLDAAEAILKVR